MITVDGVLLAGSSGGIFDGNYNNQKLNPNAYLNIGYIWLTMTPMGYYNPLATTEWGTYVFSVGSSGRIDDFPTTSTLALRSVINLKSTLKFTGDGTKNNPYEPSI